jgi:hypothetical protein
VVQNIAKANMPDLPLKSGSCLQSRGAKKEFFNTTHQLHTRNTKKG